MREFKHFWRNYKGFVQAGSLLLVSVALLFGIVLPNIQTLLGTYEDIRSLSATLTSLKEKSAVLDSIDEDLVRKQLSELTAAVPSDKALSAILLTVDRVSAQSGVALSEIALANPGELATESAKLQSTTEKKTGSKVLPFSVTIHGPFAEVNTFLDTIQHVRRLLRIAGFEEHVNEDGNVSAMFTMEAFYAPLPTTVGSVNSSITQLTDKEEALIAKISAIPLVAQQFSGSEPSESVRGKANPFSQ